MRKTALERQISTSFRDTNTSLPNVGIDDFCQIGVSKSKTCVYFDVSWPFHDSLPHGWWCFGLGSSFSKIGKIYFGPPDFECASPAELPKRHRGHFLHKYGRTRIDNDARAWKEPKTISCVQVCQDEPNRQWASLLATPWKYQCNSVVWNRNWPKPLKSAKNGLRTWNKH